MQTKFTLETIRCIDKLDKMFKAQTPKKIMSSQESTSSSKGKQGRLNPKHPTGKVSHYESESSDDSKESKESNDSDVLSSGDEESNLPINNASLLVTNIWNDSIGSTGHNVLMSKCKHRGLLKEVNFSKVVSWTGKGGSKNLRGTDLKRFKKYKEMKNILSKLILGACQLESFRQFVLLPSVHLNSLQSYVEISSDAIAHIGNILTNTCGMLDVDIGELAEYFHLRFADIRNRRCYEKRLYIVKPLLMS